METAVYFSGQDVRVLTGSFNDGRIAVRSIASFPMPSDCMINGVITNDIEIRQFAAEIWKRYALPKKNIHLIIDSSSVLIKPMTVPVTEEGKLRSIIAREFSDVDNFGDMLFDYSVLVPSAEGGGALVTAFAADRSFVGGYVDIFSGIKGAGISSIDVSQNCCVKFFGNLKVISDKTAIFAVLDGNILSLMLFVNGVYRFSNRSRLINERGTADSSDEIANALSSILQFHRTERSGSEISDIYFFGLRKKEDHVIESINALFEHQNVREFPFMSEYISPKTLGEIPSNIDLADFVYCIGGLIKSR
ncbi:MAG: type IV pilus biogenesis protein PilM [Huintestinicola sp.]